jgi:hypothetical protein
MSLRSYRTFLARPETPEPIWDWVQTVSAPDADAALRWSHDSWVASNPNPPAPPFADCRRRAVPSVAAATRAIIDAGAPAQKEFNAALEKNLAPMLGGKIDGVFKVIYAPGGFNYGITYGPNAYWNPATLDDFDSLLVTDPDGFTSLSNGSRLSTLYSQMLSDTYYSFSQSDAKAINDAATTASANIASVARAYENAGGTYPSPLPFGGKIAYIIQNITSLYGDYTKMPPALNELRVAMSAFVVAANRSYVLLQRAEAANLRTANAIANILKPTAQNGGQQTGDASFSVGFTPEKLPSANQLIDGLNTESNAVKVSISISNFSQDTASVSIESGSSFTIPVFGLLDISVSSKTKYDWTKTVTRESSVSIEMTYPGVTVVHASPTALSADSTKGWYDDFLISEIAKNIGNPDVTGYKLQSAEFDDDFGVGKAFSRLKTFVISRQPTIKMTFSKVDVVQVSSYFSENTDVKVSLFGFINLGSVSRTYAVSNVEIDASESTFSVTFGQPDVSGTIPPEQQVAYVLGGVPSYPPVS